jgi:hypothetical protein
MHEVLQVIFLTPNMTPDKVRVLASKMHKDLRVRGPLLLRDAGWSA